MLLLNIDTIYYMDKKQEAIVVCHALDSLYIANDIASTRETSWSRMTSLSPFSKVLSSDEWRNVRGDYYKNNYIYKVITTRILLNNGLQQWQYW